MTKEEKVQGKDISKISWEDYVRSEVNALLDIYLPNCKNGNLGLKYIHPVIEETEAGKTYDESKTCGVIINLVFDFEKIVNVPKE